ncbi:MAG: hypothetical protein ACO3JL_15340 [Myxococcota bacterium]
MNRARRQQAEQDRLRAVSVAAAFGDEDMLLRHGSGVAALTCPACGATGRRLANPGEDFRMEGFEPTSAGGLFFILCQCNACRAEVCLPHRGVRNCDSPARKT